jgi:DNA repair photolyase
VTVSISIATLDERLAREIEPTVAPPQKRLFAVRKLAGAGIKVNVALAPILPQITDSPESIERVVRAARDAGASAVWHNTLHLHEVTRDAFFGYLRANRPELIAAYASTYRGKYAAREVHDLIEARVDEAMRSSTPSKQAYIEPHAPLQLSLI